MKKSIIDDYYNDGSFEIARSGKNVIMKNNMSPSQHSEFVASHAGRFSLLKKGNRHISVGCPKKSYAVRSN